MDNDKDPKNVKEDFCGACLSIPIALIGAGTAGGAQFGMTKGKYQKTRKLLLWTGISISVIALLLTVYFLTRKCSTCLE